MIVVYVYGVVTHFDLKKRCSELRFSGAPESSCIAPQNHPTCWDKEQMSCTHCIFGYGHKNDGSGEHKCNSNNISDEVLNDNTDTTDRH